MNFQSADILAHSIRDGDAMGNHTIQIARLLAQEKIDTQIVTDKVYGTLPKDIQALISIQDFATYQPQTDLTIIQYGLWFPLAEQLTQLNNARLFWYHGVTPPELWQTNRDRIFLEQSQIRTHLAWHTHLAITDSPFTAEELHHHSGYPTERIRVLPLNIDVASFQKTLPPKEIQRLRAQWNLEQKEVLLYVGRIVGNKRIDLLIEAFHLLADQVPELHLLIVGDNRASHATLAIYQALQKQIDEYGLANRVTFTGRVPEVEPYYQLADIFVTASQHEGFGVPLLEAMAANLSIIASDSGAMPWVINSTAERPAGLLFHEDDAADLARQIQRLRAEPELRQSLLAAGNRRLDDFSESSYNHQARQLLNEAVELSQQGPPPAAEKQSDPLYHHADIALRSYKVVSGIPLVSPLIEWVRYNSTTHVKEAYIDPVIERQVDFNRLLVDEVLRLQSEIEGLRDEITRLKNKP